MQGNVDNDYDCQALSNIPHITKGSVKYAVAVPPGTYNYALTQDDRDASQKLRSKIEPNGSSKSVAKVAVGEEDLCHPFCRIRPLNEQGIVDTVDGPCSYERGISGADGDTFTEQKCTSTIT
ncbi:hypothetical protein DPMN_128443 [Dreissena polymorpha]|uniref:Uncharacterized protein n=1 Tax=Dreissena polymorpha TaxID=45954 RepID=A0A9D4JZP2_DREPO|nr:hypothetical protein DPMN_128443 [Dreissena polymorpha]